MIDFRNCTYQNILAAMLARIPNSYDKRDTSPIQTALGPAAYQIEGVYIALNMMQNQAFIGTAMGQDLDSLAAIGGISRLTATPAVRLGVFNTAVSLGDRFSTINGSDSINFKVTAATANPLEWWLTAETPGAIGNQYSGPILPINTIPGLTSAQLTTIIVSGSDEETDDELRDRLILALTDRPFAGNIAAYRKYLLEMTEAGGQPIRIGGVQVYPTPNNQGGQVLCSVVDADDMPFAQEVVDLIQEEIDPANYQGKGLGMAPIGALVTVVTPTPQNIDVDATVSHTAGSSMDAIRTAVTAALNDYFAEVRSEWGTAEVSNPLTYVSNVYIARVTAAILGVTGVTNVTNVTLNGSASDIVLTENATTQQVPVLRNVSLTEG